MNRVKATGNCHCKRVEFEITIEKDIVVHHCNCSICELTGFIHLIVPAQDFNLLRGREHLSEYQFNTATAKHLFCRHCGVKSFYVPRSNPDGFSVNLRCLHLPPEVEVTEEDIDGQNWEQNAGKLSHLSRPAD
jgi:hypothetical protein